MNYLKRLGIEEQRQVLEFARALSVTKPVGVSGESLLSFGGSINKKDIKMMRDAIEQDCEKVIADEW